MEYVLSLKDRGEDNSKKEKSLNKVYFFYTAYKNEHRWEQTIRKTFRMNQEIQINQICVNYQADISNF